MGTDNKGNRMAFGKAAHFRIDAHPVEPLCLVPNVTL
jgi:hypothetical protein